MEELINNWVDEILVEESKIESDRHVRIPGTFYASELPYCLRRNFLSMKSPKEPSSSLLRIFKMGSLMHDWLSKVINKASSKPSRPDMVLVKEEFPLLLFDRQTNTTISGRIDSFIIDQGMKYPYEFKSCAGFGQLPKPHHVLQIMPYIQGTKAKAGYLIYMKKNDLELRVCRVDFSQSIMDEIWKRAETLQSALDANELPEPEALLTKERKWECDYCPFRNECELSQQESEGSEDESDLPKDRD